MEIRIDKKSAIPVWQQLAEQIIFSIVTEKLKPGESLPSVRELARRLKIHRNTVSQAYTDLKRRGWLVGQRGSRVVIHSRGTRTNLAAVQDLDDLLNATIQVARDRGYTLTKLTECVEERLQLKAPDHVLVVEEEPGLRLLLQEEIRSALQKPVEGCSLADLAANPGFIVGALTVAPQYAIGKVDSLLPKGIPAIPLAFSTADEQLDVVRMLQRPSVIAVVSVSKVFLKIALSLLSPAVSGRHTAVEFTFPIGSSTALKAADVVFADSITRQQLRHPKLFPYQLIQSNSLEYLVDAMKSYDSP
jgi:DNA-binding transcriptional regulator YhcF (GntR family)